MTQILVIEDEVALCDIVVDFLTLEGFETLFAYNGETGIAIAYEHLPDLVLCDIMMPGMDGYQVLLALRDNPATTLIPFVFLTAKADRPSIRHGMELGADDYITKPFAMSDLVAAIKTRLAKHQAAIQRYAAAMEELRGNIFYMLPHELRTPLVSILGYAELLIWDSPTLSSGRVKEMAQHIQAAGDRLHRLIENFLIYAQIEIIKADPNRRAALRDQLMQNPGQLTADIARRKAQTYQRGADLQLTIHEGLAVQIALENVQKIIEELVDNAFKFSEVGTTVQVSTQIVDHTYQWIIRNRGRGMTPEQIASIGAGMQFERRLFEQQGAGLGLVVAQRLIELHAGTLEIDSAPDEETIVRVALPQAEHAMPA
jgi:two-component system, sensor histidine kinase and response regulator